MGVKVMDQIYALASLPWGRATVTGEKAAV
jgi:hypothetical protein